jgi:NADPH-dependent 2,4-dienoyl-CoA reductase/sulfur reductase-like enzyme
MKGIQLNTTILLFAATVQTVYPFSVSSPQATGTGSKERVLVVGGGIGGLSTSFDLRHHLPKDVHISMLSDRDNFQFTPSNPWVAFGERTAEDISIPMEEACKAGRVEYVPGKLVKVDAEALKAHVEYRDGTTAVLDYDYLVGATGPKLDWNGIIELDHGPQEDVTAVSVCSTPHAEVCKAAHESLIKKGGGSIVVGALQGASCFGPAYEYVMLLDHELRRKGIRGKCPITFVTAEPYVGHMGLAGVGGSYEILSDLLEKHDIKVLTNCAVDKMDKKKGIMTVTQMLQPDGEIEEHIKAGEKMFPWKAPIGSKTHAIPANLVMMIPVFKGQDCWVKSSKGVADEKGLIHIDQYMRNPTYPNIFGVGVCARLNQVEKTPQITGPPKTGYLIESMGTAVAVNIKEDIRSKRSASDVEEANLRRPSFDTLCLTDFGGNNGAMFLASPEMPPRRRTETVVGGVIKLAKVAFEKYFMFKIRTGNADPFYERFMLRLVGIERLEHNKPDTKVMH